MRARVRAGARAGAGAWATAGRVLTGFAARILPPQIYGLYVVAFVAVVIGVILYERYPLPPPPPAAGPPSSSEDAVPAGVSDADDRRKQDPERTPLLASTDTDDAASRLAIGTGLN